MRFLKCIAFALPAILLIPAQQTTERKQWNLIDTVELPPTQHDGLTRLMMQSLATSQLRTRRDVRRLWGQQIPLDARDVIEVTGLFFVDHEIPGFVAVRDPVWEVRIFRNFGISQLVWVSAKTKATKKLYSAPE